MKRAKEEKVENIHYTEEEKKMRQEEWNRKIAWVRVITLALAVAGLAGCDVADAAEIGKASWYSFESCRAEGTSGYYTASGEPFVETMLTCALPNRDFGHFYKVTNLENGKSVIVRNNDFGPGKKPRSRGVVIDLSRGAFEKIADLKSGIARVKVEAVS